MLTLFFSRWLDCTTTWGRPCCCKEEGVVYLSQPVVAEPFSAPPNCVVVVVVVVALEEEVCCCIAAGWEPGELEVYHQAEAVESVAPIEEEEEEPRMLDCLVPGYWKVLVSGNIPAVEAEGPG